MAQSSPELPLVSTVGLSDNRKSRKEYTKTKRVITPARKEQNRVAQRLYRQRRKQARAQEKQLSAVASRMKPAAIQPRPPDKDEYLTTAREIGERTESTTSENSAIQHDLCRTAPSEVEVSSIIAGFQCPSVHNSPGLDVSERPQIQADGFLEDINQSDTLPDVGECLASIHPHHIAFLDMFDLSAPRLPVSTSSGMGLLSSSNIITPDPESALEDQATDNEERTHYRQPRTTALYGLSNDLHHVYLADPYQNAITFSQVTILNICAQNAKCLGFAPEDIISDNCLSLCSPFYRPASVSDDPTALLASVSRPDTPTFLQPSLSQILFPHHPIFDLIPIPAFRERAIMLGSTYPALLNPLEIKQDILYGGLVCWGSRHGSSSGGKGQPWDLHSWEAAPWFLKKWRLLVGGKDSDLWKQSLWWRSFRGEPLIS